MQALLRYRSVFLAAAVLTVTAVLLLVVARWRSRPGQKDSFMRSTGPTLDIHVPHARGAVTIDGDTEEPSWQSAVARTGAFVDQTGSAARPYSDARLTWDATNLYLLLYAADEDLEASPDISDGPLWLRDNFHVFLSDGTEEWTFDVSPRGTLTDGRRPAPGGRGDAGARPFDYAWSSGARVAVDLDGTLNDASDDDEEWVVEMAIPLRSLGLTGEPGEQRAFHVHRCDTPKGVPRSCAGWGEQPPEGLLILDP